MYGILIAIEGLDGAGKTTILNKLKNTYSGNPDILFTREPGGTIFAEAVRELFKSDVCKDVSHTSLSLLVNAARSDHIEKVIRPALEQGKIVITDRYTVSTKMYQNQCRHNQSLIAITTRHIVPDLTFYLDIDYKTSKERITKGRVEIDHLDLIDAEEFETRRTTMLGCYQEAEYGRHVLIDATASEQEIFAKVLGEIKAIALCNNLP